MAALLSAGITGCASDGGSTLTIRGSATATEAESVSSVSPAAVGGVDPSSLKVKINEFWVSEDSLCTDPVLVYQATAPTYQEMVDEPVLGSGPVADGVYPCIIVVMSDTIRFTPSANIGVCDEGTEYSGGICHDGDVSVLPDGTEVECTDGEDTIASYMSTAVPEDLEGSNGFLPPDDPDDPTTGTPLDGAFTIEGDTTAVMFVDASGRIWDNEGTCEMSSADAGFR
ncbi:MAG: hypothetical protein KIT79_04695 [Deltaproteobacteria bacterium]|nr:hypothetical protein [Deltaproteobacteria bacterium]